MPKKTEQKPDIHPAAQPVPETPINAASRRCILVLAQEYEQNLNALIREAAQIDGVDLSAGFRLDVERFVWHKPEHKQ